MLIATLAILGAAGAAGGVATLVATGSPLLALGAYSGAGVAAAAALLGHAALRDQTVATDRPAMPDEAVADAEFAQVARETAESDPLRRAG